MSRVILEQVHLQKAKICSYYTPNSAHLCMLETGASYIPFNCMTKPSHFPMLCYNSFVEYVHASRKKEHADSSKLNIRESLYILITQ